MEDEKKEHSSSKPHSATTGHSKIDGPRKLGNSVLTNQGSLVDANASGEQAVREKSLFYYPVDYVPGENDVICGRAGAHHNFLFHSMIQDHAVDYSDAKTSKVRKTELVSEVLEHLVFIKLDETKYPHQYYRVPAFAARGKIGQAFRDFLSQEYRSSSRTRLGRRPRRRLLPSGFEPYEHDIVIVDEQRQYHPALPALKVRIRGMLPAYLAANPVEKQALVDELYTDLNKNGSSFLQRRACEDYFWHRMTEGTSKLEIHKIFRSLIDEKLWGKSEDNSDAGRGTSQLNKKSKKDPEPNRYCHVVLTQKKAPVKQASSGLGHVQVKNDNAQLGNDVPLPSKDYGDSTQKIDSGTPVSQILPVNKEYKTDSPGLAEDCETKNRCNMSHVISNPKGQHPDDLKIRSHLDDRPKKQKLGGDTEEPGDNMMNQFIQGSFELVKQPQKAQINASESVQYASDQKHANSQFALAQCFHDGVGMEQNLEKAADLYCQAAAQFLVKSGHRELPDPFWTSESYIIPESL